MALKMSPGYAHKRVRGEWDAVVIGEDVAARAKHDGFMIVDGHRMAVFDLGRSIYAQLPQNTRQVGDRRRKHGDAGLWYVEARRRGSHRKVRFGPYMSEGAARKARARIVKLNPQAVVTLPLRYAGTR